jgi:hypothetical protein
MLTIKFDPDTTSVTSPRKVAWSSIYSAYSTSDIIGGKTLESSGLLFLNVDGNIGLPDTALLNKAKFLIGIFSESGP